MSTSHLTAEELDWSDPLRSMRDQFQIPCGDSGEPLVYFTGNSLGLRPGLAAEYVAEELDKWGRLGVRGHFSGSHPWMPYHEFLAAPMARIVGGLESEVVVMNSLTANLHLMLATFYRPTSRRRKIMIEGQAFPSDHFAAESQIRWHGLDAREDLMVLQPEGIRISEQSAGSGLGFHFSMARICELIERHRDELALILLPGVQYYTGQVFDIAELTKVARANDVIIGFDLAHAAGNIGLQLHDWGPDFAVWCTYKYLNSGPGSVGGCFVHQRHHQRSDLTRLAGWWGHDKASRFQMRNDFRPIDSAEGWQLSNPPILSLAAIRGSLETFELAGGMAPLIGKGSALNRYFVDQIEQRLAGSIEILTPPPRGCQLSLRVIRPGIRGRVVKEALEFAGFETDWREPDVIRAAPVPLYNQFAEIEAFVSRLEQILAQAQ